MTSSTLLQPIEKQPQPAEPTISLIVSQTQILVAEPEPELQHIYKATLIFIAVFFIQTAASSGSIYAIAQRQNSSIVNTNNTNSLLLNEENTLNRIFKQNEGSVVTIMRSLNPLRLLLRTLKILPS
jgi:hypothetical protein